MGQRLHGVVVAFIFLVTVISLVFTYIGIDSYIATGRSVMGDSRTSVGYQWKVQSCDDLFGDLFAGSVPGVARVCARAKEHQLPPIALKAIIEERTRAVAVSVYSFSMPPVNRERLLGDIDKALVERLPQLARQYGQYRREITYMWFFFPFVIGAVVSFYYCRAFTPILYGKVKLRCEKIMFGKNKLFPKWDEFMEQNRPNRPKS